MKFAPTPTPPPSDPPLPRWRRLGRGLAACCALSAMAAAFPWTRIAFESLWGEEHGPIGARTTAGFTCLMTSLLTILLVLSEGRDTAAREAARTGSMLLMAVAAAALLWRMWEGPGILRGVTAAHSNWFVLASLAVATAVVVSRLRLRTTPPR